MNSVGIDVSKGKSMVAALRPMGEVAITPREISHTAAQLENLLQYNYGLGTAASRVFFHLMLKLLEWGRNRPDVATKN